MADGIQEINSDCEIKKVFKGFYGRWLQICRQIFKIYKFKMADPSLELLLPIPSAILNTPFWIFRIWEQIHNQRPWNLSLQGFSKMR